MPPSPGSSPRPRPTPGIDLVAYGLSATAGRVAAGRLPDTVRRRAGGPDPGRSLCSGPGRAFDHPAIERWTGPVDVVHGTNFVVPPSRRAARLVTVHDLTPVRFPELCSPTSLRYPELIRRALDAGCVRPYGLPSHGRRCRRTHFRVDADAGARDPQRADAAASRRCPRDESEPPYILAIGTVEPRKGLPDLVAAFDRIADSVPDLHLKIAGPLGWGEEALAAARPIRPARGPDPSDRMGRGQEHPHRRARCCSPIRRCTRASACHPSKRCRSVSPSSPRTAGAIPEVVGDAALLVPPRDDPAPWRRRCWRWSTDTATRERLIAAGTERARVVLVAARRSQLARPLPLRWPTPVPEGSRREAVDVQTSTHVVGSSGHRLSR